MKSIKEKKIPTRKRRIRTVGEVEVAQVQEAEALHRRDIVIIDDTEAALHQKINQEGDLN